MDTVIVSNSQFYSHYPKRIPQGTVNAEAVLIQLDSEWDNLTVRIHWLNVASNAERKPLLERDQPNTIPWEVLTDLGELRMGLVGMDGETVIKPTIWLTYGYVADGVDPESGSDPQPPTPSWEQQMVEQATQANQAAQAAQKAAEEAAESVASVGPYADEAKKSAEAAKASQEAAATSAQKANEAAQTAQNAAGSIGDAVKRAEDAATAAGTAQQAAEAAQGAAARSAETAQGAATTANQAAQESNSAATKAGQYLTSVESAAQAAASARDQATTAATTAQDHATAASTAKDAAEQAAATAGSAQSEAAQSAQSAAGSASAAQAAQQAAEAAAAVLPKPTKEDAGKVPLVNPEGTGYIFGEAGGSRGEFERIMEINVTEDDVSVIERDLGAEYSSVIISTIDFDKGNKTPEPTAITTTGNLYLWLKNSKNTNDRQIRLTVTGTLTINKRNTSICVENKGIVWKASGVINQVYSVLGGSNTDGQQIQTYIPVLQGETTSVDTLILTAYQGAFLNGCNLYVYGVRS